jgi:signal transduction histidine kinase
VDTLEEPDRIFCLFDNEESLAIFLKSVLSRSKQSNCLLIFSKKGYDHRQLPSYLREGFDIHNITLPTKKLISKTFKMKIQKELGNILSSLPSTINHIAVYLDFSRVTVSKTFVQYVESTLIEFLIDRDLVYSVYAMFLETGLKPQSALEIAQQYPYFCLVPSQILPNLFYSDKIGEKSFPSNLRQIYQPIWLLLEELKLKDLEKNRLNKELFHTKTQNDILEASLAYLLPLVDVKEDLKQTQQETDLFYVIKYRDLKKRFTQKSQLLSSVTHDLKSPLAAILGFGELLRDGLIGPVTSEMEKHIDVIIGNSKRMVRMIDSILEYERLDYHRDKYISNQETFDLVELIDELKIAFLPQLIQRNQDFQVFNPSQLEIVGNRELIIRVLQNIIDNAIKYSPMETGKIELFLEERMENKLSYVHFTVKDNGYGFAEQDLKRVFDPFTKFEPGSTGTGLGLSITKKIVEEIFFGEIKVESAGKNTGSTVWVKIPRH